MEEAGLEFRATKDLDIVLHIEALNAAFGEVFWKFVEAGRYEIRQASDTGKPVFYCFQKPVKERSLSCWSCSVLRVPHCGFSSRVTIQMSASSWPRLK